MSCPSLRTATTILFAALIAFAPINHSAEAAVPVARPTSTHAAVGRNERLLAVAEGFEALTETAFAQEFERLNAAHEAAARDVAIVNAILSVEDRRRLETLHGTIRNALRKQDRSALALAAVESYRVLVSAQDAGAAVPVEVSLLDYAGFKLEALARADVVRWDEMARALAYADSQWTALSPRVLSKGLAGAFESTLAGMKRAIQEKNTLAASVASADELALVDLWEEHFSKR
jgi:hypothetical protein